MSPETYRKIPQKMVALFGKENPLHVWCRILNLKVSPRKKRIARGWDPERAILTPAPGDEVLDI